jgi:hypothetical protein
VSVSVSVIGTGRGTERGRGRGTAIDVTTATSGEDDCYSRFWGRFFVCLHPVRQSRISAGRSLYHYAPSSPVLLLFPRAHDTPQHTKARIERTGYCLTGIIMEQARFFLVATQDVSI